jgi:hypothetical protein
MTDTTKKLRPERHRPVPPDFAEWAPGKVRHEIKARYKCGYATIARWQRLCGLAVVRYKTPFHPMPQGFAEIAPAMTLNAAATHYKKDYRTIVRWHKEAGTKPRQHKTAAPAYNIRQTIMTGGDGSLAGTAAHHLRRYYPNVFKATVLDRAARAHLPADGKDYYVIAGRGFLHQDEMIALADSHGFRRAA